MNQKNGKNLTMKRIGLGLLALALIAGSKAMFSEKDDVPLIYVNGKIINSDSGLTFVQPNDPAFRITDTMLLLQRKRDEDTVLSLAKLSYEAHGDSLVKLDTLTHVRTYFK